MQTPRVKTSTEDSKHSVQILGGDLRTPRCHREQEASELRVNVEAASKPSQDDVRDASFECGAVMDWGQAPSGPALSKVLEYFGPTWTWEDILSGSDYCADALEHDNLAYRGTFTKQDIETLSLDRLGDASLQAQVRAKLCAMRVGRRVPPGPRAYDDQSWAHEVLEDTAAILAIDL